MVAYLYNQQFPEHHYITFEQLQQNDALYDHVVILARDYDTAPLLYAMDLCNSNGYVTSLLPQTIITQNGADFLERLNGCGICINWILDVPGILSESEPKKKFWLSGRKFCRFETQLTDQRWNYMTFSGAVYPCYAANVDVCQTLIRTESGYERCLKAVVSGLSICHHGTGWTTPSNVIKGFPGVVIWDGEHYCLNLFVSQAHYEFDELDMATTDVVDVRTIDLSAIMADILAEG